MGAKCPERISRSGHLLFALHSAKHQLAVLHVAQERLTGQHIAAQDPLRQQRFNRMLQISAERSCAELRIVGRVDDELFCSLRQLTTQLLVGQTAVERRDLQVDDTLAVQRVREVVDAPPEEDAALLRALYLQTPPLTLRAYSEKTGIPVMTLHYRKEKLLRLLTQQI